MPKLFFTKDENKPLPTLIFTTGFSGNIHSSAYTEFYKTLALQGMIVISVHNNVMVHPYAFAKVAGNLHRVHDFCCNKLDPYLQRMGTGIASSKEIFVAGHSSSNQAVIELAKENLPVDGYIFIDPVDCAQNSVFPKQTNGTALRINAPVLLTEATLDPMYVTNRSAIFFHDAIDAPHKTLLRTAHFSHSDLLEPALVRLGAFFRIVDSCESPTREDKPYTQKQYRSSMASTIKAFMNNKDFEKYFV
jgi:hypothetical protein